MGDLDAIALLVGDSYPDPMPLPNFREKSRKLPIVDEVVPQCHTLTIDRTLTQLETDSRSGLTDRQITQRQQQFGANELVAAASHQWWQILLDQFTNIMLVMLIIVAIVSGIFDFMEIQAGKASGLPFKDTIAILSIVILNGILGYLQESRAEQALAALKRMAAPKVRVLRDSRVSEIDGRDLVPGDTIYLEAGNQIAADARLIEAVQLQVRESALTGEATATSKTADTELATDTPLGDRVNLVYQGTEIITGRGVAVVTETGMRTELGKIAALLQGVESRATAQSHPRIQECPFDSDRQRMSIICEQVPYYLLFAKGSPESILDRSTHIFIDDR